MSVDEKEPVLLGKVNGYFGVNGWLKVFSYTEPKEDITTYRQILLKVKGVWKSFEIIQGRLQGKTVVIQLKGYNTRELSAELIGCDIAVAHEDLPTLAKDDFYWRDLIGLTVINNENITLGKVSSMLPTGANDVVVVKSSVKGEMDVLIPYVFERYILEIDLNTSTMKVDWLVEWEDDSSDN